MITTLRPCSTCHSMRLTPIGKLTIATSRVTTWSTAPPMTIADLAAALDVVVGLWQRADGWGHTPWPASSESTTGEPRVHADRLAESGGLVVAHE